MPLGRPDLRGCALLDSWRFSFGDLPRIGSRFYGFAFIPFCTLFPPRPAVLYKLDSTNYHMYRYSVSACVPRR